MKTLLMAGSWQLATEHAFKLRVFVHVHVSCITCLLRHGTKVWAVYFLFFSLIKKKVSILFFFVMFLSPGSLLDTASVIVNIGDFEVEVIPHDAFGVKCEKDLWVDRYKRQHSTAAVVPLQS